MQAWSNGRTPEWGVGNRPRPAPPSIAAVVHHEPADAGDADEIVPAVIVVVMVVVIPVVVAVVPIGVMVMMMMIVPPVTVPGTHHPSPQAGSWRPCPPDAPPARHCRPAKAHSHSEWVRADRHSWTAATPGSVKRRASWRPAQLPSLRSPATAPISPAVFLSMILPPKLCSAGRQRSTRQLQINATASCRLRWEPERDRIARTQTAQRSEAICRARKNRMRDKSGGSCGTAAHVGTVAATSPTTRAGFVRRPARARRVAGRAASQ